MGKRKAKPAEKTPLQVGEIEVAGQRFSAMLLQLTAEPLIEKHGLPVDKATGCYEITAPFLKEYTEALAEIGYRVSPDLAYRAWVAAAEYIAIEQKKTRVSPS